MTAFAPLAVPATQPTGRLRAGFQQIFVTAFLAFGLMVPSASATCLSRLGAQHGGAIPAAAPIKTPADEFASPRQDPRFPVSITGLWKVTFTSGGKVVDVGFDAWHDDGTEMLNDYTDPIEGNVCLGAWEQTGTRTYSLKHPSWSFDPTGKLQGTVVILENVTLSEDAMTYTGSYKYDIYDTAGKFVTELTGKEKATRITPN